MLQLDVPVTLNPLFRYWSHTGRSVGTTWQSQEPWRSLGDVLRWSGRPV